MEQHIWWIEERSSSLASTGSSQTRRLWEQDYFQSEREAQDRIQELRKLPRYRHANLLPIRTASDDIRPPAVIRSMGWSSIASAFKAS
jgi:hypothetical protein